MSYNLLLFGRKKDAASAPVNTVAPVISGDLNVGAELSTTNGTWTNAPIGYTYQWKRGGANITGATAAAYTLASDDRGLDITCTVTATNSGGSAPASSNALRAYIHDFMNETLDGATLTRAATTNGASRFNSSGVMVFENADVARFDYNYNGSSWILGGLLVEPQRSNLVPYTYSASTGWGNVYAQSTKTDNYYSSLDGLTNGIRLQGKTQAGAVCALVHSGSTMSISSGSSLCISAFIQYNGAPYVGVGAGTANTGGGTQCYSVVSNSTKQITGTTGSTVTGSGITNYSGSWYRQHVSGSIGTATSVYPSVQTTSQSAPSSFITTQNTSTSWNVGIFAYQFEVIPSGQSILPTSYIQTIGAAVTRYADVVTTVTLPASMTTIRLVYDDDSTQDFSVTGGSPYTLDPTAMNRYNVKRIVNATA